MTFREIIGQEQIVGHMQSAVREKKVSHAYLLVGDKGSGKKLLAKTYAAAILCESGNTEPCGECKSCKQIMSGNHPDIKYVTHEKPNTISVDDIRVQLNADITVKPYASEKKIYIIDEAEKMGAPAQNAMLKTIEEPPEYAVIMLLVTNAGMLLQTILSRCIQLNVRAVDKRKIKTLLKEKYAVSETMAELAAGFSDGVVGRAIDFSTSGEFIELKNEMVSRLSRIDETDAAKLYDMVREWGEHKEQLSEKLSLSEMWFRDVLVVKTTDSMDKVLFKEAETELYRQAELFSMEALMKKIDAIHIARSRLRANVNTESTLMLLLLSLRDNK